ncbi:MAG: cobalamin biosynthesis protein [Nitrospinae bacterium]|nr:cobalamin biosynthesis protein [Nitrospinota bacterium]
MKTKKRCAFVAITINGAKNALALNKSFEGTTFIPEKFRKKINIKESNISFFKTTSKELIKEIFNQYEQIVWFGALGVLVRFIGPLLQDKKTDPAVISIDEQGTFVISVVSGHLGGANKLSEEIAEKISATPVITTASDVSHTIAVDLLGSEFNWKCEKYENITKVSASVVNGEKVAIIQTTGERNWWKYKEKLPSNLLVLKSFDGVNINHYDAFLFITDEENNISKDLHNKIVMYRPKSLIVGIGCNRNTPLNEIEDAIFQTLKKNNLSFHSVRNLATIDKKRNEKAFIQFSEKYNLPFRYFTPQELNSIKIPNPSEYSLKYVKAQGVAEPAALLSAKTATLLQEKVKFTNVTIAIARIEFENN